jgi:1-deoxyxylulose-5-phosphate synthase
MEYRRLGNSGLKVSRLCLGMMTYGDPAVREWSLPLAESEPFVVRALEAGINFFDTANAYSAGASEEITGQLLKKHAKREDVVVASKVYFSVGGDKINNKGLSRKNIFEAIDASLKRLDMDYLDLYQIHRWDPETPIEETMEALHDVVKSGRVRYIGASSMHAWQFAKAQFTADAHGWTRFVAMQNHYNLVYREEEREMIPQCVDMGVGVIPWSPLARGLLAGNRTRDGEKLTKRAETDTIADNLYATANFDIVDRVAELAKAHGTSSASIALAWMLGKSFITAPIIGASKMHHLEDAIKAFEIKLSADEIASLESLYQPQKISGHQ